MTSEQTDWRALCARLATILDSETEYTKPDGTRWSLPVVVHARDLLAQPEPVTPTDEEIGEWQSHCAYLTRPAACGGAGVGDHYWAFDVECDHVASIVRAALTRWGRPTIKPVPVAERLPGPEDCDARGWCWYWHPGEECWEMVPVVTGTLDEWTHWLPHHALPLPQP